MTLGVHTDQSVPQPKRKEFCYAQGATHQRTVPGDGAQLVESLPSKQVHSAHLQPTHSGGPEVQGCPQLRGKFEDSLGNRGDLVTK